MVLFFAPRKHSSRCADETQRSRWSGCDAKNAVEHIRQLAREMLAREAFELFAILTGFSTLRDSN